MSFQSSFLLDPSAVRECSPWGAERLALEIAGGVCSIGGLSRSQKEALSALYRSFVAPDSDVTPDIEVRRIGSESFRRFDKRGWEYALDVDFGERRVELAGVDLVASIDWTRGLRGRLSTSANGPSCHGPMENFLRIFSAYSALDRHGVFLHSAAVRQGGEAALFVGPSGAGKSTVARSAVARDREILSDDLNPVTSREGVHVVHGCPFLGDIGSRSRASLRLGSIYRLEKGSRDTLRRMTQGEAVASLLACTPFVNRDPHRRDQLVARLDALVATVPAYRLTFRREGTFWQLLEEEEEVPRGA